MTTNPCLACSTNQHCCSRLSGLLLTEEEYLRCFARYRSEVTVRRSGKMVIVSSTRGGPCPHWENDGCGIYLERPIDCRVFPYIPGHIIDNGSAVKIVFHGRSDCPRKESLFLPEGEVETLLISFGRMMYGETRSIVVRREKGILSRIRYRVEAAIFRRMNSLRNR